MDIVFKNDGEGHLFNCPGREENRNGRSGTLAGPLLGCAEPDSQTKRTNRPQNTREFNFEQRRFHNFDGLNV
jgi:hypothetical protein